MGSERAKRRPHEATWVSRFRQGIEASLDWIWIDNCCIDKTSGELAASINSMFRWYREAAVCIAYIADATDVQSLSKSVWFRRGRALQELLAPRIVVFVGKRWNVIGHKCPVTSIPEDVLVEFHTSNRYHLGDKLSWYQNRQTQEPEDKNHSLIGIAGITMNMQYCVGVEMAKVEFFHRVSVYHRGKEDKNVEWYLQNWDASKKLYRQGELSTPDQPDRAAYQASARPEQISGNPPNPQTLREAAQLPTQMSSGENLVQRWRSAPIASGSRQPRAGDTRTSSVQNFSKGDGAVPVSGGYRQPQPMPQSSRSNPQRPISRAVSGGRAATFSYPRQAQNRRAQTHPHHDPSI